MLTYLCYQRKDMPIVRESVNWPCLIEGLEMSLASKLAYDDWRAWLEVINQPEGHSAGSDLRQR